MEPAWAGNLSVPQCCKSPLTEHSVLLADIREGDRCVEELVAKGKTMRVRLT